MKFYQLTISYFLLSILLLSCGLTQTDIKSDQATHSAQKKTQAILLTQAEPYNNADKNVITGDYIARQKITVPPDLAPQNKWIMFEGPVLENDFVAYRYYADSRHRFDIYGKRVSDLVMDTVGWDYHNIMDWGSDILKVGNALGIGSPAIYYKDSLYTLSQSLEKTIEVFIDDNNKSGIRTIFTGLSINDHTFDLIQDWTIEAGNAWSDIHLRVTNGSLPKGMQFATGFIKHLPTVVEKDGEDEFVLMNWGKQSFHDENLGMAIAASKSYKPEQLKNELNYAMVFKNAPKEVKYQLISVWERDPNNIND